MQTITPEEQFAAQLRVCAAADDVMEVRAFSKAEGNHRPRQFWGTAEELTARFEEFSKLNAAGYNICLGVNPRAERGRSGDAAVTRARAVFVDFDKVDMAAAVERLRSSKMPTPSLFIASGHGYHAYWRLAQPQEDLALFVQLQKSLVKLLGTDPLIVNPERVMRSPGFHNLKPPIAPTRVLHLDEKAHAWSLLWRLTGAERLQGDGSRKAASTDVIPQGERNDTLFRKARELHASGCSQAAVLSSTREANQRCQPPLSDSEVEEIAKSACRYSGPSGDGLPLGTTGLRVQLGPMRYNRIGVSLYRGAQLQASQQLAPFDSKEVAAFLQEVPDAAAKTDNLTYELLQILQAHAQRRQQRDDGEDDAPKYLEGDQGILMRVRRGDAEHLEQLTNFTARIVEQQLLDDGVETSRSLDLQVQLLGKKHQVHLLAEEFHRPDWPMLKLGSSAIVHAMPGCFQHAMVAIRQFTGDAPTKVLYGHSGWREIDGVPHYLDSAGGVSHTGRNPNVMVSLPDQLSRLHLCVPKSEAEERAAIQALLGLLELGPKRLVVPLVGCRPAGGDGRGRFLALARRSHRRVQERTGRTGAAVLWLGL